MVLSIRAYTIIKVTQATHHEDNIQSGTCRGIQCSYLSLISVCCKLKTWSVWCKKFIIYEIVKNRILD